jgi:hypothetical protein
MNVILSSNTTALEGKKREYFIPIVNNLDFDFRFMEYKLNQYFGLDAAFKFSSPKVDLFTFCVMMKRKDCTEILELT